MQRDDPPPKNSVSLSKWIDSATAWILDQGEQGDWSRRAVLDPALERILPNVHGKAVLDLGCGEGRYCRLLQSKGAAVVGIDPVPQFIEHARARDSLSTYHLASAEDIPLADGSVDLVVSYLSLIDIPDLESACREVCRVLKKDGELIVVNISNLASTTEGWVKDARGMKIYRTIDRYMEHFSLDIEWRGIRIRNYHRPLSYILGLFLDAGLVLNRFIEPLPEPTDPEFANEYRAPNFQIYTFRRFGNYEPQR